MTSRISLLPYQKEDIVKLEDLDGIGLNASEMGLGKTIETLMAIKRNPSWQPALVVCPASVKYNWVHESKVNAGMQASVCEGQTPPRLNAFDHYVRTPITVMNYDILHHWLDFIRKYQFKTIVFDECQYLQNPDTLRTKAAKRATRTTQHRMFLSGTPLTNRPSDLWPVLNMLWPHEFNSKTEYLQRYCKPRWTPWGWDYSGACNLDELHHRLKSLGMIRRRKVDVLKDLPEKVRRIEPCELSDPQEYKEASEDFMTWIKKNMAHKTQSVSKAEKLTQAAYLLQICARLKLKSVVNWCNRFLSETGEKLVIFAEHHKAMDVLQRRIEFPSVRIDGGVDSKVRQASIHQFQNDPKIPVFIGNRAACMGITLTAASTVGFAEFWRRPGDHVQGEDRIHRIGQNRPSWCHYFAAVGTIEERLCKILQEKQQVISAVLDGGSTPEDLDIYEILMEELSKET